MKEAKGKKEDKKEGSPGWYGLVDWAPSCKPNGRWFSSQSGHMSGLLARSPVRDAWEATTHWCFSPSPSLLLCLEIKEEKGGREGGRDLVWEEKFTKGQKNMLPNSRGLPLGVLRSKKTWLSPGSFIYLKQVKETGDSYPELCLPEGSLSHCLYIVHYLVNYMLISSLQLTTFIRFSCQLIVFTSASPNYYDTI